LHGILGYAELLGLDHSLDLEQKHRIARIKAGGAHLLSMIEEILSFAKLDGRHEVVHAEPVDARSIAQEAAALLEPAAGAKGLSFVLDIPDAPVRLVTDGPKARQVLINLCGNAVKYTEKGEVRLRVRREDGRVRFEVRDTGIGIAPEHMTRIFERFWRADESSTRTAGGLGIGLAAAREYAQLLSGDIEVDSEPGRGTTFRLWLPGQHDPH
jgi:signal transduction histidine kinase